MRCGEARSSHDAHNVEIAGSNPATATTDAIITKMGQKLKYPKRLWDYYFLRLLLGGTD